TPATSRRWRIRPRSRPCARAGSGVRACPAEAAGVPAALVLARPGRGRVRSRERLLGRLVHGIVLGRVGLMAREEVPLQVLGHRQFGIRILGHTGSVAPVETDGPGAPAASRSIAYAESMKVKRATRGAQRWNAARSGSVTTSETGARPLARRRQLTSSCS